MSFQSSYALVPLGEVARFINGDRSTNYPKGDDYVDDGTPFISATELREGRIDYSGVRRISSSSFERLRSGKIQRDDVLFCLRGSIGKIAYINDNEDGAIASSLVIVRATERINSRYLFFGLSSQAGQQAAMGLNNGAAQPNLSVGELQRIPLPLPPLPIQRRIAGILSAYDELIENSQRRIKILESMARALYREWFVHFRFPGHESVPRVPSPLGAIPQGWEVKKLESLMKGHIGGGWGKEVPDDDHTEPAWVIRGTDIPDARSAQVAGVPHRFHTPSNLRSRRLEQGDILFEVSGGSKGQPVGRTLLLTPQLMSALTGDVICASFCKRISPDANRYGGELLYLSFLEGYESGEIEQFQVQSTGISNFKWTEYISKTDRVVAPEPLRSSFREHVVPFFAEVATLGLQIQNLRRTRDLLLPRLLSGQIDVEAMAS
jgi:type I restriction enzyme S subunit